MLTDAVQPHYRYIMSSWVLANLHFNLWDFSAKPLYVAYACLIKRLLYYAFEATVIYTEV